MARRRAWSSCPARFIAVCSYGGRWAARWNWRRKPAGKPPEVVPVPSLGSMAANAAILADFLAAADNPIILVSLSKGVVRTGTAGPA